jgi:hypothetical protein
MKKLKSFLINLFSRFKKRHRAAFCKDLPPKLKSNTIYIIGANSYEWLIAFECPCGCKDVIQLNLLTNSSPFWNYKLYKGKVSIYPSIYRTKGCKSHFTLRNGIVKWY